MASLGSVKHLFSRKALLAFSQDNLADEQVPTSSLQLMLLIAIGRYWILAYKQMLMMYKRQIKLFRYSAGLVFSSLCSLPVKLILAPEALVLARDLVTSKGLSVSKVSLVDIPTSTVELSDTGLQTFYELTDALDAIDEVTNITHNVSNSE